MDVEMLHVCRLHWWSACTTLYFGGYLLFHQRLDLFLQTDPLKWNAPSDLISTSFVELSRIVSWRSHGVLIWCKKKQFAPKSSNHHDLSSLISSGTFPLLPVVARRSYVTMHPPIFGDITIPRPGMWLCVVFVMEFVERPWPCEWTHQAHLIHISELPSSFISFHVQYSQQNPIFIGFLRKVFLPLKIASK